jgi:hypothetical protein
VRPRGVAPQRDRPGNRPLTGDGGRPVTGPGRPLRPFPGSSEASKGAADRAAMRFRFARGRPPRSGEVGRYLMACPSKSLGRVTGLAGATEPWRHWLGNASWQARVFKDPVPGLTCHPARARPAGRPAVSLRRAGQKSCGVGCSEDGLSRGQSRSAAGPGGAVKLRFVPWF